MPRPETVCPFRVTFLALTLLAASTRLSGASIRKLAPEPAENATLVNEVAATTSNVPAVVVVVVLIAPVPLLAEKFAPSSLTRPPVPGFMVMEPGTPMVPFRSSVVPVATAARPDPSTIPVPAPPPPPLSVRVPPLAVSPVPVSATFPEMVPLPLIGLAMVNRPAVVPPVPLVLVIEPPLKVTVPAVVIELALFLLFSVPPAPMLNAAVPVPVLVRVAVSRLSVKALVLKVWELPVAKLMAPVRVLSPVRPQTPPDPPIIKLFSVPARLFVVPAVFSVPGPLMVLPPLTLTLLVVSEIAVFIVRVSPLPRVSPPSDVTFAVTVTLPPALVMDAVFPVPLGPLVTLGVQSPLVFQVPAVVFH